MRSKPLGFCGPTEGAVTTKRVNEFENREKIRKLENLTDTTKNYTETKG